MLTPQERVAHDHLVSIMRRLPSDFEPYGLRNRDEGSDCSCGCKHFEPLQILPFDWGVCTNPKSPRCSLLTFEHQGCEQFEYDEDLEKEFE
jgi:hypothetical protein